MLILTHNLKAANALKIEFTFVTYDIIINRLLSVCWPINPFAPGDFAEKRVLKLVAGLKITAGQRTMSGLIADLTGQTPVLAVILTGHFWIQTFYFPYSCCLMLDNAAMIS